LVALSQHHHNKYFTHPNNTHHKITILSNDKERSIQPYFIYTRRALQILFTRTLVIQTHTTILFTMFGFSYFQDYPSWATLNAMQTEERELQRNCCTAVDRDEMCIRSQENCQITKQQSLERTEKEMLRDIQIWKNKMNGQKEKQLRRREPVMLRGRDGKLYRSHPNNNEFIAILKRRDDTSTIEDNILVGDGQTVSNGTFLTDTIYSQSKVIAGWV